MAMIADLAPFVAAFLAPLVAAFFPAILAAFFTAILAAIFAALLAPLVVMLSRFPIVAMIVGVRAPGGAEQRAPHEHGEQEPRQVCAHALPPTD
jgi:hypothetical protein